MTGPCVSCGDTGYPLSCGGPSLCPTCDTGASQRPKNYLAMRKRAEAAEQQVVSLTQQLEALKKLTHVASLPQGDQQATGGKR
jgi:hypothetical protein